MEGGKKQKGVKEDSERVAAGCLSCSPSPLAEKYTVCVTSEPNRGEKEGQMEIREAKMKEMQRKAGARGETVEKSQERAEP